MNAAVKTAQGKDVAFVFLTADSGEDGYIVELNIGDRNDLNAWHGGVCSENEYPFSAVLNPDFIGRSSAEGGKR